MIHNEDHLASLRKMHPTYTEEELQESYEKLVRFFDRGWDILLRLHKEGRLDEVWVKHQRKMKEFDTHPVCEQLKLF